MRSPAIYLRCAMALALLACALALGPTAQAQPPLVAQATDDEDETPPPPPPGRQPEAPPEEANDASRGPSQLGSRRRPDPFNVIDEVAPRAHPATAANPDHDVVVCEAGCDGPRGAVVYRRKKLE